jgi:hypothetical protein
VTAQLNAAINKVIVEPEINARLRAGAEVTPMSIDQLAAFVRTEIENNQMILKATNLTAEWLSAVRFRMHDACAKGANRRHEVRLFHTE